MIGGGSSAAFGGDDEELRFCVPAKVEVLDALSESLLATLPTPAKRAAETKMRKVVFKATKSQQEESKDGADKKQKKAIPAK